MKSGGRMGEVNGMLCIVVMELSQMLAMPPNLKTIGPKMELTICCDQFFNFW